MKNEQDDKLDNLLRSKLARKDFVLKDEYWQDARRMVDDSRMQVPRPRKYITFLISGIMLALVSVATINYSVSTKHAAEKERAVPQSDKLTAGEQTTIRASEGEGAQEMQAVVKPAVRLTSANAGSTQPVFAAAHKTKATALTVQENEPVAGGKSIAVTTDIKMQPVQAEKSPAIHGTTIQNEGGTGSPGRTNHILIAQGPLTAARTNGPDAVAKDNSNISDNVNAGRQDDAVASSSTLASAGKSWNKYTVKPVTPDAAQAEPAVSAAANNGSGAITGVTAAEEAIQDESAVVATQDATLVVQNKPLASEIIDVARATRTALAVPNTPVKQESHRMSLRKSNEFKLLEAGATFYNPSGEVLDNFNFHVAAKYGFHIGRKTDLTLGVGYSRLHQSKGTRTYNVISYDLGEQISTNGVNTVRLDYIDLPVTVYYALHGRHGLSGGFAFSYLVRSADLLKKPDQTKYNINTNGYFGAFAPFDVQLNIGYTYMLRPRIMLSASYNQGVIDITKNNIFRSDSYNTNSGARFTIGYQLH
jgi:hypothetical protein